ncbi:MAG: ATP-binding protein [Oscillospiraceae bacterium]|nr:ATP-binding protein [Oscillospiraceae bacterium]
MDVNAKKIADNFTALQSSIGGGATKDAKPCVCVHGKRGTGKTALLDEVKDMLLKSGANVFFSVSGKGISAAGSHGAVKASGSAATDKQGAGGGYASDGALRELLRQLLRLYGKSLTLDFAQFLSSYVKDTLAQDIENGAVKCYEKSSISKFIYDCVKTEPAVFIIDDLDKADTYTINLLGNLLMTGVLPMLLISHSDRLENKALSDMLYRNARNIMYIQLHSNRGDDLSSADKSSLFIDETMLVLKKDGREKQLIKHYLKIAEECTLKMAFERAVSYLHNALDVAQHIDDKDEELNILLLLGQTLMKENAYTAASENFIRALNIAALLDKQEKRAEIFLRLVGCHKAMRSEQTAHEYIMLSETFFSDPKRRAAHYELYAEHIIEYLELLMTLGEDLIFWEKHRQALSVCRHDDKSFLCKLIAAEGYMHMELGAYEPSHEKLSIAVKMATESESNKSWCEIATSLGILCEQIGKPELSLSLWKEIISKSHDCAKVSAAMVNIAVMRYEQDNDVKKAARDIAAAIELCIISGEDRLARELSDTLVNTPLAEEVNKYLRYF